MKPVGVIMAGGIGERFWPHTGEHLPKYAMPYDAESTFLGATYRRLKSLYRRSDIYVVTAQAHSRLIRKLLPDIPVRNILVEPYRRNTAGAVTLTHCLLRRKYPDGTVVSFYPADHIIRKEARFKTTMRSAIRYAGLKNAIVILGIKPDFPATGFGYIEKGATLTGRANLGSVRRFVEKPDTKTASRFFNSGRYLWNSGVFTWTLSCFEDEMKSAAPAYWKAFEPLMHSPSKLLTSSLRKVYRRIRTAPIDKVLIEKLTRLLVIEAEMGWDDVGTWDALRRVVANKRGNVLPNNGYFDDVHDCLIRLEPGVHAMVLGVRNIVIVQKGKHLLISTPERTQDISKALKCMPRKVKKK